MDTTVTDSLIGALVDGRYRIRGRVARGGMATVYTALDERLERTVALKIIHPGQRSDPNFLDRFTDEAKTIARLTHPNVVAVYDQGTHDGLPYLVMEYVRGRTLRELLADKRRLPPMEALAILEQMLAAVAGAHRAGLVHRDIKPENVLVAEPPGGGSLVDAVVKVADFGLARAVEASADEAGAHLLATVAYVAPELVTDGHADPRTDVYSAGIVLFEMLTGRVPYDGDKPVEVAWKHVDDDVPPPSKYVTGLPAVLDDVVARATRRDPGGRPTDAGALLAEVQAAREDLAATENGARVMAAPTVPVASLAQPTTALPTARPSWARLPGRAPEQGRPHGPGRRRAAAPGSGPLGWWRRITGTVQGRRAVAAAIVVLGLLIALGGWWFGAGRYTEAPALTGMTKTQAQAAARQHGIRLAYDGGQFSEKIAKDTVLGQRPGINQRIVRGGTITLTLSLGPERYTVPDENGQPFDQAAADLTARKLVPKREDAYDDAMPKGNVISTDPPKDTVLPPGTVVTVRVSKGKAPVSVPNVVGMDLAAAQAQLQGLGLSVAVQQQQSDKPANQVIAQDPGEGAGLEKNARIILTVSTGPPLVPVPDLANKGLTFDQANQMLQQVGLVGVKLFELPNGQVRQQNPAPGTQVPKGSQVQLWIYP
ncbi:MAG: serine/threonine protein kinase [Actinobacteria bacterium 13_2_20CM_2_72_6]|nr:MAG: serine/threonine protein kinase [Actinobacteria bacterium 13_2_20CM_2_72_6]